MKPFEEKLRYEYDLTPYSAVFDFGFYKGDFSRLLLEKCDCRIFAFEPCREFYEVGLPLAEKLGVTLFNMAVGGSPGKRAFYKKGDMSGRFSDGEMELVNFVDINDVHVVTGMDSVALAKLNIEGGEFELLETILERGMAQRYENIQVQPHAVVPDAEKRWAVIQAGLLKTHHLTFDAPWCWQNYELNA